MIHTDKLIICVAPTGSFMMKDVNPNIPLQPDEIAEEVYRSWNEGASLVHLHARDGNGKPTNNPEKFAEIVRTIRAKDCDIIIEFSTSPGRERTSRVEDGFKVLDANPEMAGVDVGVLTFMRDGEERVTPWTRGHGERLCQTLVERGIKPELEIYNSSGIVDVDFILKKVFLTKPYWFNLALGLQNTSQGAVPFTPKTLIYMVEMLPEDSLFLAMGVGASETPATVQSILLGGHVRVGFEDNLYYSRGVLAKSNAELVAKIARIGIDLGRKVASPDEARELLGISAGV
jgi:3-keto-5-aminohexanoate cleavage enzyme